MIKSFHEIRNTTLKLILFCLYLQISMKNKVISVFLLLLFCIIIAFPGYGSNKRMVKKMYTVSSEHAAKKILLKILATGINMAEEERATEEDEDSSVEDVCYLMSELPVLNLFEKAMYVTYKMQETEIFYSRSIPCPPPDYIISMA